ncbi:uncharacterized protein LOC108673068 [Hyalella azteca]|uniref:Uncharacterized protein LOC108673068 n=1 Tax=Hyalella azteca TaxID=294128 RepID=A0A8B7NRM1_HYAAZ|nr:uncharacterized protein LOC108673068 [Hyalella azteca]
MVSYTPEVISVIMMLAVRVGAELDKKGDFGTASEHGTDSPSGRVVLLLSFSGLNKQYLDTFDLPNLLYLRDQGPHPVNFEPQYPGTSAPNSFGMVTGVYPETHGVLAQALYDSTLGRVLTSNDPEMYTQNPNVTPLWILNEQRGGVSACIMWPGCEYPFSGRRPTYFVPQSSRPSFTFTDAFDLAVAFATARFSASDYRRYVVGDNTRAEESPGNVNEHGRKGPSIAESTSNIWSLHHLSPSVEHWYTSEREEKYVPVKIEKESNNLDEVKRIVDSASDADNNISSMEKSLSNPNYQNDSRRILNASDDYNRYEFATLSEESLIFTLNEKMRANFILMRFEEPHTTAELYGPTSTQMEDILHKLDDSLLYLHLLLQEHDLHHKVELVLVSDLCSVPFGPPLEPSLKLKNAGHKTPDLSGSIKMTGVERNYNAEEPTPGLQETSDDFIMDLAAILQGQNVTLVGETPLLHIWPNQGSNELKILNLLENYSNRSHFSVVKKREVKLWHFSQNPRIADILAEANPGFAFVDKRRANKLETWRAVRALPTLKCTEQSEPVMLMAGPSFPHNREVSSMQAIDVFAVVTRLLNLTATPNNASMIAVDELFNASPRTLENKVLMAAAICALLVTIGLLFVFVRLYKQPRDMVYETAYRSAVYRTTVQPTVSFSPTNSRWDGTSEVVFVKQPDPHTAPLSTLASPIITQTSPTSASDEQDLGSRHSNARQSTRSSLDRSELDNETASLITSNMLPDQSSDI